MSTELLSALAVRNGSSSNENKARGMATSNRYLVVGAEDRGKLADYK